MDHGYKMGLIIWVPVMVSMIWDDEIGRKKTITKTDNSVSNHSFWRLEPFWGHHHLPPIIN